MESKHPLDTNENSTENSESRELESKRTEAQGGESAREHDSDSEKTDDNLLKSLAIVGIVVLILIGLYGSSRVIANLPDFGRSLASGFVSVTSQFFGADEDEDADDESDENGQVIVIENDDDDEDQDTDEDEDADRQEFEEVDDNTNYQTPRTQPTTYRTVEREFRTVPYTTTTSRVSDPNGDIDLEVSILAVGKIHPQDRDFVEQDWLDEDDKGAVIFQVKNIGTKTSGEWEYRVKFPTDPSHTFNSDEQMELRPGERIEYTIQFDSLSERNNEFSVEVDPGREIDDVERDNNRVEIDIDIRD